MFLKSLEILQMARAQARHAAARLEGGARNVANADTPGYQAGRLPSFAEVWDRREGMRATRAGHLDAGDTRTVGAVRDLRDLSPNGNSVSLETEMTEAALARQAHDIAIAIQSGLLGLMRQGLGRRS